jgi:hypothetical protein
MNYTIFFLLLNLILISRLQFTLRDQGITGGRDILWLTIIPLFGLPFLSLNLSSILFAGYLLIRPIFITALEKRKHNLNRYRILTLFLNLFVVGLLVSPLFDLRFAGWTPAAEKWFTDIFLMGEQSIHWQYFHAVIFSFLMILNESNIVIRYILEKLDLAPLSIDHDEIDDRQFRTGRVIGFLERIFVFQLILLNQYTAIGFIIAAKGIVRYPDFGKKNFSEYILIGTLLSVLFAILFTYIAKIFN